MRYFPLQSKPSCVKRNGFTLPELMVGVVAGTLIMGASSALRTTQTRSQRDKAKPHCGKTPSMVFA